MFLMLKLLQASKFQLILSMVHIQLVSQFMVLLLQLYMELLQLQLWAHNTMLKMKMATTVLDIQIQMEPGKSGEIHTLELQGKLEIQIQGVF